MNEFKGKNYLITGCAGFIASVVARKLSEAGANIVGIDNLNSYYDVQLKRHRLKMLESCNSFEFQHLDIENRDAVNALFVETKFDGVLNLAARAGVRYSLENPYVYMSTNATGSLNLLHAMKQHGVKKYVLASTSSLYAGQKMPFLESLPVNEPISPYAASKKAAEAMAYAYHHLFGIDVSVVRYFTVYGPAGRPDMSYFRFISWIHQGKPIQVFGDGSQARDFTFVDDIADGTIAALRDVGFEVMNLGGGNQPYSLNTLIEKIEGLLDRKAVIEHHDFHKADMKTTWADISKAREILGWEPQVDLDTGLASCVDWFVSNLPWSSTIQL